MEVLLSKDVVIGVGNVRHTLTRRLILPEFLAIPGVRIQGTTVKPCIQILVDEVVYDPSRDPAVTLRCLEARPPSEILPGVLKDEYGPEWSLKTVIKSKGS